MLKMFKATIFIGLMVGLSWWITAMVPLPEALGTLNQPSVNQVEQITQNKIQSFHQVNNDINKADLTLQPITDLDFTSSYTISLPIVLASCIPSPPGESDNVVDALTICSGQTVSGHVNDNDWDDVYKIWAAANQQVTISMNGTGVGGPGDADLYLYPPSTTDINSDPFSDFSENPGNNEFIQGTVLVEGFWYIDVFDCCDGDGGTNYNLTVTLSGPEATGTKTFNLTGANQFRDLGRSKTSE